MLTGEKQREYSVLEILISQMLACVQSGEFPPPAQSKQAAGYVQPDSNLKPASVQIPETS